MTYDHNKMRQYIFGELEENEAEEFDELVVCDVDFADELAAVEKEMLDEFVNDELDPEFAEKVRIHYSKSAHRRQKLAFAETLRAASNADAATISESPVNVSDSRGSTGLSWTSFFGFGKPLIAGFAVLIAIVAGIVVWQRGRDIDQNEVVVIESPSPTVTNPASVDPSPDANRRSSPTPDTSASRTKSPEPPTPGPSKPMVATFVLRPAFRGSGQIPTLQIPGDTRGASFSLTLEPHDFEKFDVVLTDDSGGRAIWSKSGLRPSKDGRALSVGIESELPRGKVLRFTVTGVRDGAGEPFGTYNFRLENR